MNVKVENWKLFVLSVFYIIFAIISYTVKKEQFLNFFMIAGLVIAVVGALQIVAYFLKKDYMKPYEFSFAFGILYTVTGLIVASKPYVIVDNYPIVLSGLVVLDSTLRLQYAVNVFRLDLDAWKWHALLAIVPLVLALVLILCTFSESVLHNFFSFLLILDAIANFVTLSYYKHVVTLFERKQYEVIQAMDE